MLIMAPALLLILIAAFPVLDVLLQQLDDTLSDTGDTIMYGNLIQILAGGVGLILMAGIIWTIVHRAQTPEYLPPPE